MSTAVLTNRLELSSVANGVLNAASRFWFVVTVIGQLFFAFALAAFYGLSAARGDVHGWSRFITHGYVPGDRVGNFAVMMHIGSAVVLMLSGAVQLVPGVRARFPVFHRWNGRTYMLTVVTLSLAGLYMTWIRGSVGDLSVHLASTLNVVLIWVSAGLALRYALARNFSTHRRWALRLFLVASASWFFRLMFFLYLLVFGQTGFDPTTFRGPVLTIMAYAQFLVPLAVLEIYLRARDGGSAIGRMATAAGLFVMTLAMGAGIFAVAMAIWVPQVKAGFDSRTSIAETLSATIASSGIDQAVKQYEELKWNAAAQYNFDEDQLNTLGYQLIQTKKFKEAIRVFQLNVEAYPQSSNVYDSLGEAYMDDGDRGEAVANYRRAVQLNPNNRNAATMLEKLSAR
jgi:uncharacterized membrane protein